MRLIDADALRERYDVVDPAGTFSYCDRIMATIDKQPTIDAIPVEWLLQNAQQPTTTTGNPYGFVIDAWREEQEPITGETSDGYHTFNELYHHRAVLFSVIVANYPERAWKSKKHNDGTMYDGMFIVGIETPDGQATYHYDIDPYWDMFKCRVLDRAPEWDGHTPAQAIERIGKLKAREPREPRVMTLEEAQGDDEVWFEFRPSNVGRYADCYMSESGLRTCVYFTGKSVMSLFENSEYGKTWRCWTSRPTDAQREATPWN